MRLQPKFVQLFLAVIASCFVLTEPGHAGVTVSFSDSVKANVDPQTQQEIQDLINDGLKKLAKKNSGAKDLLDSNQTIKIICLGDPKAEELGLKPDPKGKFPDYAMTHGDFGKNKKPKKNGTTYIAVNCTKLKKLNWYHRWTYLGVDLRMFDVLLHEVLHATNGARRHPPDSISIYDTWVTEFLAEIKSELRTAKNAASTRRQAARDEKKKKRATRVGFMFDEAPLSENAVAVSYDSTESWEGGTTPLGPVAGLPSGGSGAPDEGGSEGTMTQPISQDPASTFIAEPDGWEVCGSGCKRPGTGGPPQSPETWCSTTPACLKRGTECGCHLVRKKRKDPDDEMEYVAKPLKKVKSDLAKYRYHCSCMHPVGTSAGGSDAPAMSLAQDPVEEISLDRTSEQVDEEAPEESQPSELPAYLTVKASQHVLTGGVPRSVAVAEATIKLELGEPELPVAGNVKDEETGAGEDPIQGLTRADGTLELALTQQAAAMIPISHGQSALEVDLTPRESTIVQIDVDPDRAGWAQPESYLHAGLFGYVTRSWLLDGVMLVTLHYPVEKESAVANLIGQSENVIESEPNSCRGKQRGPSDPFFTSKGTWKQPYDDQWAIKRVGLTAKQDSAWELMQGKLSPVVVAVIDTGLDWNHKDIAWKNIWKNEGEIEGNGIDDDENGYVDDIIGWDFFRNNSKPWDHDGHGTFVAGVIAATWGNGVGISGINPNAKIMVLKALNSFGHTRASFLAEAIVYAADNGARVINLSVGGKDLTHAEQMAIDYAHAEGVVIIVAAGNEGIDVSGFGPAAAEHAITVASTDLNDQRAVFSNWGAAIDIAAPGMDVLSLRARRTDLMRDIEGVKYAPGDGYVGEDKRYYRASGTSMSAPIVAGVASLILSRNPRLSNVEVERMLLHSARDVDVPGVDQHTGYGLLDARAAILADPAFFVEAAITGVKMTKAAGKTLVRVMGTADASAFAVARIEIGAGKSPKKWKKVGQPITARLRDGVLGEIEAENFRGSKQWVIRLTTEDESGRRRVARFILKLG